MPPPRRYKTAAEMTVADHLQQMAGGGRIETAEYIAYREGVLEIADDLAGVDPDAERAAKPAEEWSVADHVDAMRGER